MNMGEIPPPVKGPAPVTPGSTLGPSGGPNYQALGISRYLKPFEYLKARKLNDPAEFFLKHFGQSVQPAQREAFLAEINTLMAPSRAASAEPSAVETPAPQTKEPAELGERNLTRMTGDLEERGYTIEAHQIGAEVEQITTLAQKYGLGVQEAVALALIVGASKSKFGDNFLWTGNFGEKASWGEPTDVTLVGQSEPQPILGKAPVITPEPPAKPASKA